MKAALYYRYGPPEVVSIGEVEKPVPKDNEILVRVHASSVTVADHRTRALDLPPGFAIFGRLMFGWNSPKRAILGVEFAGVIEAIGKDVTAFKTGDAVFGSAGLGGGAHAEYLCLKQDGALALKPPSLSFEEAAALPFGGETALQFLTKAQVKPGEQVLINGASSNVGTFMVQMAKRSGAVVTGVCSAGNADLVRELGADHVIDYAKTDFAASGARFDVVADCVGNVPFRRGKGTLKPGGRLVQVVAGLSELLLASLRSRNGLKVIGGGFTESAEDMRILAELADKQQIKPVIDRTYALDEIVEAHRYVDSGRKRGSVVVKVV